MIRRHTYLLVLVLLVVTVVPFLLGEAGVIDIDTLSSSKENGWWTIITGVFMHGNYAHLTGNLPLLILSGVLVWNFYKKYFWPVVIAGIVAPSLLSYSLGLNSVGISGLVFALLWFLVFRGLMSKDRVRFIAALVILAMFGYTLKGAVPPKFPSNVNWIAHLAGLMVGFMAAFAARLTRKKSTA